MARRYVNKSGAVITMADRIFGVAFVIIITLLHVAVIYLFSKVK